MDEKLLAELQAVARAVSGSILPSNVPAVIEGYAIMRAAQIRAEAQRTYLPLDPKGPVA